MKYKIGQQALLLDSMGLPAFSVKIIGYNEQANLYKILYRYGNSEKEEEQEVPEERLKLLTDI